MDAIQTGLERRAARYGVEIVDVRIKQAELPEGTPLQSRAVADAERAPAGGDLDPGRRPAPRRDHPRRCGRARRRASMPQSFSKDADFYDFYRAMQSYNFTFGRGDVPGRGLDQLRPVAEQLLPARVRGAGAIGGL